MRVCLGTTATSEILERRPVHRDAVAEYACPERRRAAETTSGLGLVDLEHLDGVPGEAPSCGSPGLCGRHPRLGIFTDTGRADEDDVEIAYGVCLALCERPEYDSADRPWIHLAGERSQFLEDGVSRTAERPHSTTDNVFVHQREEGRGRRLPALDEPERYQLGQHAGRLRRAHVGQAGDGPQVQLSGGLGQDCEDAPLDTRDQRFDGSTEVHSAMVPSITHP